MASGHGLIVQQHHLGCCWAVHNYRGSIKHSVPKLYSSTAAPAANIFYPVQIFSIGVGWALDGGYLDEIMPGHDWSCSRPGRGGPNTAISPVHHHHHQSGKLRTFNAAFVLTLHLTPHTSAVLSAGLGHSPELTQSLSA